MMQRVMAGCAALLLAGGLPVAAQVTSAPPTLAGDEDARLQGLFESYMRDAHVPGLVYGVVKDGRIVALRGLGVQDIVTRRPVTADTQFRIASMSKAFTAMAILKLRDDGKLSLDAPAETYVPEMRGWRYPTSDSRKVTVADLLHHSAGYVEDNPWGDRQQPLSEAGFTAMLRAGVPFAQEPGKRMEYSNFGFATLGRIVGNVGGAPYQQWIGRTLLAPLGMTSTGYDVLAGDQSRRALGYRWQDEAWMREPDMADGAFGAMGGMQTTGNDYGKWVAFLLSAWPARDGAEAGPVARATVRGIVEGANFVEVRDQPRAGGGTCRTPTAYGKGWFVVEDCDLGRVVTHSGGYPGYGSLVMLLPDAGVGVFAFTNKTYSAPRRPLTAALAMMKASGLAELRALPVSSGLAAAYGAARTAWQAGDPAKAPLADNVALDRDLTRRRADMEALKAKVGTCAIDAKIVPVSAMEGAFEWTCTAGRIAGRVQRAPTPTISLQVLDFVAVRE